MRLQVERRLDGKVFGISCPETMQHDCDIICQFNPPYADQQQVAALRLVECWNALEGIDDPASFMREVKAALSAAAERLPTDTVECALCQMALEKMKATECWLTNRLTD